MILALPWGSKRLGLHDRHDRTQKTGPIAQYREQAPPQASHREGADPTSMPHVLFDTDQVLRTSGSYVASPFSKYHVPVLYLFANGFF